MRDEDRHRLKVVAAVDSGKMRQKDAAAALNLCVRQLKRILSRYRSEGDSGVLHRLRGRVSNRRIPRKVQERAMAVLQEEACQGFGPTYACEHLATAAGIRVSDETVRRWMKEAGLWLARMRRVKARQWREPRACFGEMVQMDTSKHDWFEGRGEPAVLIAMIDDATSRAMMRFFPQDSTETNFTMLRRWLKRHGRPKALYADKASHFKTTRACNREEALEGIEPETQIGRALRALDIEYIPAHSPQAKGRVERAFRTAQDRLVKGLRLAGVETILEANRYLEKSYLPLWNRRFTRAPSCLVDTHRSARGLDLDGILCVQERRVVANDYTLRFRDRRIQIDGAEVGPGLRGAEVTVQVRAAGKTRVMWKGRYLRHRVLGKIAGGPQASWASARASQPIKTVQPWIPPADHPWRKPCQPRRPTTTGSGHGG